MELSFFPGSRRLLLRSFNHQNIGASIENGLWATQAHNERKLAEAFATGAEVLLVFSVNASGHFQGYARMVTPIGGAKGRWTGDAAALGGVFGIQWECLFDLPFPLTNHLLNPLNENKPVKISRDGTELPPALGEELVRMMEQGAARMGTPRPKVRPLEPPISAFAAPRQQPPPAMPPAGAWPPMGSHAPQQPPPAEASPPRRPRRRSRSRSRSRDRDRGGRERRRSRSRERGGREVVAGSYEEYTAQYMAYCERYLRSAGWDGRGGVDGMTSFWNATPALWSQGGPMGGPPMGGPPRGPGPPMGPPGGGWGGRGPPPGRGYGGRGYGRW